MSECIAGVMNTFKRITCKIEMFLGSNDVNILTIVYNFANEWNVL
jgi:hypothetical protein